MEANKMESGANARPSYVCWLTMVSTETPFSRLDWAPE